MEETVFFFSLSTPCSQGHTITHMRHQRWDKICGGKLFRCSGMQIFPQKVWPDDIKLVVRSRASRFWFVRGFGCLYLFILTAGNLFCLFLSFLSVIGIPVCPNGRHPRRLVTERRGRLPLSWGRPCATHFPTCATLTYQDTANPVSWKSDSNVTYMYISLCTVAHCGQMS